MTIFDILSFYQSQAFSVVTDPLIFTCSSDLRLALTKFFLQFLV